MLTNLNDDWIASVIEIKLCNSSIEKRLIIKTNINFWKIAASISWIVQK